MNADAVAIVAALVAVICGAPVASAMDWSAIEGKVNEMEISVQGGVQQVNTIVNRDNAAIGADVERKLTVKAGEARAVLEASRASISSRSLTEQQARELFGKLKEILADVNNQIQPEVSKLAAPVQSQIRDLLYESFATGDKLANDIYALLRE